MLDDGFHATVHAHLAVASGGTVAEAACHGERFGAECHGVTRFGEGAVQVGVGAEWGGGNIAVAGGEAVRFHSDCTHARDEVGELVCVRHDELNHGGGRIGCRQAFEDLVEAVDTANEPVVGSAPDAFAEFGVVAARLQVAFKSHMSSSAWCVCRVGWSVEAAGDGLCGDPQTSLYLGYPKSPLVTRCQQSTVYFKPRFSSRRSRDAPRSASLKWHRPKIAPQGRSDF